MTALERMRAATAFTAVVLRQLTNDRSALFFTLALPVLIITIIGATFGGQTRVEVGFVDPGTGIGERLYAQLATADGIEVTRYDTLEELRRDIRRFNLSAGVVIAADVDQTYESRAAAEVGLMSLGTSEESITVRQIIGGVVDEVAAPLTAAAVAADVAGVEIAEALARAEALAAVGAGGAIEVRAIDVDNDGRSPRDISRFAVTAPQNLVLFTFITGLTSATLLVAARRAGVMRRAGASPTGLGLQIVGMGVGWFAICLLQSLLIVLVGAVAFGVRWGDPVAGMALILLFALLSSGAGLLVGALGGDVDRVGSLTPILGMVLGALGGCMVPIEVFPDQMLTVARLVPHYWAVDAWRSMVYDGAGLTDIASNLAVLAGFAVVLAGAATAAMRRSLLATG